jgi:hypothetical protein
MSSLALHILYRLFNDEPDVVCERVFFGDQRAPDRNEPVISLESQRPLDEFAAIAFTLSYEMDYFNVIQILRRAGIPIFAEEREPIRNLWLQSLMPWRLGRPRPLFPQ